MNYSRLKNYSCQKKSLMKNPAEFTLKSSVSTSRRQVRVWEIPEGGLRRNMTEAVLELYGHSRRVGLIEWHPTSSGILFSAGYDYKVPNRPE